MVDEAILQISKGQGLVQDSYDRVSSVIAIVFRYRALLKHLRFAEIGQDSTSLKSQRSNSRSHQGPLVYVRFTR